MIHPSAPPPCNESPPTYDATVVPTAAPQTVAIPQVSQQRQIYTLADLRGGALTNQIFIDFMFFFSEKVAKYRVAPPFTRNPDPPKNSNSIVFRLALEATICSFVIHPGGKNSKDKKIKY